MWGNKSCCKSKSLCPVSFGLALGITAFLAMILWSAYMMMRGVPSMTMGETVYTFTWGPIFAYSFLCFVKGFVFGLVLALFYDLIACCCKSRCCRDKSAGGCGCGCGCTSCGTKDNSTDPNRYRT